MQVSLSNQLRSFWKVGIISVFGICWLLRNQTIFEDRKPLFSTALSLLWRSIREVESLVHSSMHNSIFELMVLKNFQLLARPRSLWLFGSVQEF